MAAEIEGSKEFVEWWTQWQAVIQNSRIGRPDTPKKTANAKRPPGKWSILRPKSWIAKASK
jgi:hypothetical protein